MIKGEIGFPAPSGTVMLEGVCGQPGGADADAISLSHLRVQGVFGASRRAWLRAIGLVVRGDLDPSPLVTHLLALESWERAFALLSDLTEDAIKVQLTPL